MTWCELVSYQNIGKPLRLIEKCTVKKKIDPNTNKTIESDIKQELSILKTGLWTQDNFNTKMFTFRKKIIKIHTIQLIKKLQKSQSFHLKFISLLIIHNTINLSARKPRGNWTHNSYKAESGDWSKLLAPLFFFFFF